MAQLKILARNWLIEVNSGTIAVPTWTKVGGINTFTLSNDKEDADTTDFDSDGYNTHMVASRSNEVVFEGSFLEDETGVRDAGQAEIEALAELIGPEAEGQVRIVSPNGKGKLYTGSFTIGDVGGGVNDITTWGATMTVSGKPTVVTLP